MTIPAREYRLSTPALMRLARQQRIGRWLNNASALIIPSLLVVTCYIGWIKFWYWPNRLAAESAQTSPPPPPPAGIDTQNYSSNNSDPREAWAYDLAVAVGQPAPSQELIDALVAWQLAEDTCLSDCGGRLSAMERNNVLNTTQTGYGELDTINSHGVKHYDTRENGIAATVRTLQYLGNGYEGIVAGIKANDPRGMLEAVAGSKWCLNCYSGAAGLLNLFEQVRAR